MARATRNGAVLAGSDRLEVVEGNVHVPPESVRHEHLHPRKTHTVCGWKGLAGYLHVEAGGNAGTPPGPIRSRGRRRAAGFVAFRCGVEATR